MSAVAEAVVEIRNPSGLHARPAATFVRAAAAFASDITITNHDRGDRSASAKSVIGVMGIGVSKGHRVTIRAVGDDAAEAVDSLTALVASGLGEGADGP